MENTFSLNKITDIFDNAVHYIDQMRTADDLVSIPREINQYRWEYFRNVELTKEMLEGLALFAVDKTYRIAAEITSADKYVFAYFSMVASKFWDAIQDRGVDTFYILDNTMSEDRFWIVYNIFRLSGYCVVTPYTNTSKQDDLETIGEKTVHSVLDGARLYTYCTQEVVEAQLQTNMKPIQNIMYMEIDSRVNYLDKVQEIGKNSKYLCILRTSAPVDKRVEIVRSNFIRKHSQ